MIPHPGGALLMEMTRVGKYDITAKIGQGAMGEVYKAHDPILNRFVAIKTMSAAIGSDDELRKRFLREAQSAARLNHPNIITLFDFGEDQGKIYMAMELLEGSDLKDLIAAQSVPQLEDKLGLMEQICDGLAFAHMQEVVHRDLKPANIHVQPNGQVKIMDFGLARLGTSEMTRTGMVMGTPHYMSPEQVKGKRADFRSDIFSLGAVFYELLTGHKPFDAESLHAVLFQVMEHQPEDVRHWSPEVPNILVQVVDKALSKDPDQRYSNAGEMREGLRLVRQVLAGEIEEDHALATLITPQDGTVLTDGPPVEATVLEPSPPSRSGAGRVSGSSALKPAPSSKFGKTAVPSKTSPPRMGSNPPAMRSGARRPTSRPPVPRPMEEAPSRMPIYIGGAVAVVAIAIVAAIFLRPPTKTGGGDTGGGTGDTAQTRMLLDQMVEVARKNLELKDYKGAIDQADKVIKLEPGNADAAQVREKARKTLADLDAGAAEARAAVQAGDSEKAAAALSRVLEIDPNHPVAAELSSQLNSKFRDEAERARREMRAAANAAERAKASLSESSAALSLGRQAEDMFLKNQFMASTQKFLESRDAYERARAAAAQRVADVNRPPVTTPATMPPVTTPVTVPPTTVPPTTLAPVTQPPVTVPVTAPPTMPVSEEPAVRKVIAEYGRALQNKDLALFRSVKPNLSGTEEDKLRASFANIKDWRVNISISSVVIDGGQATVHASRNDTVNGKAVSLHQTFRLTKGSSGWTIRDIGQ